MDGFNIRNPGFLFEDFDLRDQPSAVSFDVRIGKGISNCLLKVLIYFMFYKHPFKKSIHTVILYSGKFHFMHF